MSQAPRVDVVADSLNGVKGYRTPNGLFFTQQRIMHLMPHTLMLESRAGIQTHGIWDDDEADRARYGNVTMKIISNADRAWARIQRNSARVVSTTHQNNGSIAYVVRVSTTHTIGRSVIPLASGGRHVRWVDTICLVVGQAGTTAGGVNVTPVITCFPIAT